MFCFLISVAISGSQESVVAVCVLSGRKFFWDLDRFPGTEVSRSNVFLGLGCLELGMALGFEGVS